MIKPFNYILVNSKDRTELEEQVKRASERGYVCQGGICVAISDGIPAMFYSQAMIRAKVTPAYDRFK